MFPQRGPQLTIMTLKRELARENLQYPVIRDGNERNALALALSFRNESESLSVVSPLNLSGSRG